MQDEEEEEEDEDEADEDEVTACDSISKYASMFRLPGDTQLMMACRMMRRKRRKRMKTRRTRTRSQLAIVYLSMRVCSGCRVIRTS